MYGEVQASCRLSGMPEVSLTFTNSSVLNDVRFHPCVRPRTWESNQTLSFIPPDGAFKLMSYRFVGVAVLVLVNSICEAFSCSSF